MTGAGPSDLDVDLDATVALAERVRAEPVLDDVLVHADVGDDARRRVVDGLAAEAAAWLEDPSRPLHVVRIGRWVVRVSADQEEVDDAAAGILEKLRRAAADASALADAALRLVEGNRRLARLLSRRAAPTFGAFEVRDGGAAFRVGGAGGVADFLFATLVGLLEGAAGGERAANYVVMEGESAAVGRIDVVVQRVGKLSPHGARLAAEAELARAVALLAAHGIPWDGRAEFPPDEPGDPGDMARPTGSGGADASWCVLRPGPPNELLCGRCGATQSLPPRYTADVFRSIADAFRDLHRACQVGDRERFERGRLDAGLR